MKVFNYTAHQQDLRWLRILIPNSSMYR
ncbi:hypothetical protein OUL58_004593 [Escherichia coli]|nr:hypothetical protein [Escherichia coli]